MKFRVFIVLLFFSLNVNAALWSAENSWSESYEKQYANWISKEVDSKFFLKNNISTDCADAIIALRMIFARINSLPFAITTHKETITNLSDNWDKHHTDEKWQNDARFLNAINDVLKMTSTRTLISDTYPIAISTKYLSAGALYINSTAESGHAELVARVAFDGIANPITFYASTVPRRVRELIVYPFMKINWPKKGQNGFVRFKWAVQKNNVVSNLNTVDMPGYSLEQYSLANTYSQTYTFDDFVTERLIGQPLDGVRKLQNLASHLIKRIEDRVVVVEDGFRACSPNNCNIDTSTYYNHSTFSRDDAIQFLIIGITELIYSDKYIHNVDDSIAGQMVLKWSQIQNNVVVDLRFKKIQLGYLINNWNEKKISSDPNKSIVERWGFN